MKLFKKAVATVLAAVLALSMLTACGGGGSSAPSYKMAKAIEASKKSGKTYMELSMEMNEREFIIKAAADTEKTLMAIGIGDTVGFAALQKGNNLYTMTETEVDGVYVWTVADTSDPDVSSYLTMLNTAVAAKPQESMLSSLKVNPSYEVPGKGTFYAEILSSNGQEIAYCFSGEELKYMVVNSSLVYGAKIAADFPEDVTAMMNYTIQ